MENLKYKKKIFTIPNMLSFFRLILIPLMIYFYCVKHDYTLTVVLLVISGISDILDGYIARKYQMISDLGKVLDPIADKLTQLVILICLTIEFSLMKILLVLLILKELFVGITGILVIKKTGFVPGANWHGKAATFLLDFIMIFHVAWADIPEEISKLMILTCVGIMILSLILYVLRNINFIKVKSL